MSYGEEQYHLIYTTFLFGGGIDITFGSSDRGIDHASIFGGGCIDASRSGDKDTYHASSYGGGPTTL